MAGVLGPRTGCKKGQQTRITSKLLSTMAKLATAASKGKLHVLRLDSGPFCVDGAKVGFLKNLGQVHFCSFLHPQGRRVEAMG